MHTFGAALGWVSGLGLLLALECPFESLCEDSFDIDLGSSTPAGLLSELCLGPAVAVDVVVFDSALPKAALTRASAALIEKRRRLTVGE